MSETNSVKNVAIVGASGNLGKPTLDALIAANRFNITIITRSSSNSPFPKGDNIRVESGDYGSPDFLASALKGQHALILTLGFMIPPDLQSRFIDTAAAQGVEWIFPAEFGSDGNSEELVAALPPMMLGGKKAIRDHIETLAKQHGGKPKYIALATNPWTDFSLPRDLFSISAPTRTATLYSNGTGKFNTTTLRQAGLAIARLLSLPPQKLATHANSFVYVSSFLVSQADLLAATQRVTGTKPEDWTIEHKDLQQDISESRKRFAEGDIMGMRGLLFGSIAVEGGGGDYESTKGVANEELGLEREDLDEVVRGCLESWGKLGFL